MTLYERMLERYATENIPWDDTLPPPEVCDFARTLPPGNALDLGCGTGRAAIYLAKRGWQVDGVDFIPKAIEMAQRRAAAAEVRPRFYVASVTKLDFLTGSYDFALDVGCSHALQPEELQAYYEQLVRLVRPGGHYLLFARLKDNSAPPGEGLSGIDENMLRGLLRDGFVLNRIDYGRTTMDKEISWRLAWFWYIRRRQRSQ